MHYILLRLISTLPYYIFISRMSHIINNLLTTIYYWKSNFFIVTVQTTSKTPRSNSWSTPCTPSPTLSRTWSRLIKESSVIVQNSTLGLYRVYNSLQPLPRLHHCKRLSKLSTQCECTVTPIGLLFFVQPIAAKCCWRGWGGKHSSILGKKHNI